MADFTVQHLLIDRLKSGRLEYAEDLYNHYYYIASKYYKKYDGNEKVQAKKLAEEILKRAILEFAENSLDDDYKLSRYIFNKFQHFDRKVVKISDFRKTEQLAYNKDLNVREKILKKYQDVINECIECIYNFYCEYIKMIMKINGDFSYLDEDFKIEENFFNKEDIIQEAYLYAWELINRYYDKDSNKAYFCGYLSTELKRFYKRKTDEIKSLFKSQLTEDIKMDYYDFEYYLNKFEEQDIINQVENMLSGNDKQIFKLAFSGYSYADAAKILNITRSRAQQTSNKVLKLVKEKGLVGK